jgi:hypothetical protein
MTHRNLLTLNGTPLSFHNKLSLRSQLSRLFAILLKMECTVGEIIKKLLSELGSTSKRQK